MLFDIDWQGAQQVRERLGDDVVSIFVLPPSMRSCAPGSSVGRRIRPTTIEERLDNARHEIERWRGYEYVIVNDDLQRAYKDVLGDRPGRAAESRPGGEGGRSVCGRRSSAPDLEFLGDRAFGPCSAGKTGLDSLGFSWNFSARTRAFSMGYVA